MSKNQSLIFATSIKRGVTFSALLSAAVAGTDRLAACATQSFHSVERFLENFQIGGVAGFFACGLDPFFLKRVFGRAIGFVKDAEDARERQLREFLSGELVGDVVPHFILG